MVEAIRQGDIPGVQLRVRQVLEVSIDEAWLWVTDSSRWSRWLCEEFGEGSSPGELHWRLSESGGPVTEVVAINRSEPPLLHEISLRRDGWEAATHVLFEIGRGKPGDPNSSELSVFHRHFERLSLSEGLTVWEHYRRRWSGAADRLASAVVAG